MFGFSGSDRESSGTDESTVDRRRFLQRVGAAGGAAALSSAGLVRVTTGEVRAATATERRTAIEADRTQSLLDALGRPSVGGEVTVQSASVGSTSLTVVRVPTDVGPVVVGRSGDETAAHFYFEDADRSQLPSRFRSIPEGTDATLYGGPEGVVLGRLATEAESEAVVSATDVDADQSLVYTTSEIDGFEVRGLSGGEAVGRRVTAPGRTFDPATTFDDQVQALGDGFVFAANPDICDDADWCWRCVQSTAVCGGCMMACGTAGTNPASAVGCALCLTAGCGATGFACSACVDCNT